MVLINTKCFAALYETNNTKNTECQTETEFINNFFNGASVIHAGKEIRIFIKGEIQYEAIIKVKIFKMVINKFMQLYLECASGSVQNNVVQYRLNNNIPILFLIANCFISRIM